YQVAHHREGFISVTCGSLSCLEAMRPPVKQRRGANALRLALERGAVGQLHRVEHLDAREVTVDEGRVGQGPQLLSRLEFRRIGRQEEQVDMVGHTQSR